MMNATAIDSDGNYAGGEQIECLAIRIEVILGRLYREDSQLHHLLTHFCALTDRPTNAKARRAHAVARILYTWLRREADDPEAVANDIETLAPLGRSIRWQVAVKTWAHVARTDPVMFHQQSIYTNFAID